MSVKRPIFYMVIALLAVIGTGVAAELHTPPAPATAGSIISFSSDVAPTCGPSGVTFTIEVNSFSSENYVVTWDMFQGSTLVAQDTTGTVIPPSGSDTITATGSWLAGTTAETMTLEIVAELESGGGGTVSDTFTQPPCPSYDYSLVCSGGNAVASVTNNGSPPSVSFFESWFIEQNNSPFNTVASGTAPNLAGNGTAVLYNAPGEGFDLTLFQGESTEGSISNCGTPSANLSITGACGFFEGDSGINFTLSLAASPEYPGGELYGTYVIRDENGNQVGSPGSTQITSGGATIESVLFTAPPTNGARRLQMVHTDDNYGTVVTSALFGPCAPAISVNLTCEFSSVVATINNTGDQPQTADLDYSFTNSVNGTESGTITESIAVGAFTTRFYSAPADGSTVTFTISSLGISETISGCSGFPSYNVSGACVNGSAVFTVTNVGGAASSTENAEIITGDPFSGPVIRNVTIPALGFNETFTATEPGFPDGRTISFVRFGGEDVTSVVNCVFNPGLTAVGECNQAGDGSATFTVFNDSAAERVVSYEIVNPLNDTVLDSGSLTLAGGGAGFVTYGVVDGDVLFRAFDANATAEARVPDCFIQTATPTATDPPVIIVTTPPPTNTPTTTPTDTPPEETEVPEDVPECGEVVEEDPFGFPVITYDATRCEENVELPRTFEPIPEIGEAVCRDWVLYQSNEGGPYGVWRTPSQQLPADASQLLSRAIADEDAANLNQIFSLAPSQSPDGEYVAFATNRDGNFEIYIAQVDNSSGDAYFQRATFNTIAVNMDPMWSPGNPGSFDGGELVVYESARRGFWALYMLNVVTGEEIQLTDNESYNSLNAYWHPNGDRLIFQTDRDGFWQIYELDLTQTAEDGFPRQTRLTDGVGDYLDPVYNADGTKIATRSNRDGINNVIYIMDADGSNLESISDGQSDATNAVWSPLENLLVYEAVRELDRDIYVYDLDTGETRILTNNEFLDYAPTWRCGTTNTIFASEAQGAPNIYETDALPIDAFGVVVDPEIDGDQLIVLTDSPFAETFPQGVPSEENGSRLGALPGGRLIE